MIVAVSRIRRPSPVPKAPTAHTLTGVANVNKGASHVGDKTSEPSSDTAGSGNRDLDKVQVVVDDQGILVLGPPNSLTRFLSAQGLARVPSTEVDTRRLSTTLQTLGAVAHLGATTTQNSGRWMKLTKESAEVAKKLPLLQRQGGTVQATAMNGTKFAKNLNFEKLAGGLANPAALAGVGALMAQMAMEQSLKEITDYLAQIDAKVDDVLRAQKDEALARVIGVRLTLDEALKLRAHTGGVSEVTWSKVQGAGETIAIAQAHALRRLDAIAEKMEKTSKMGPLAKQTAKLREAVQQWLGVLALCDRLQDSLGIIELDRVLETAPEQLDAHRTGLLAARQERRQLLLDSTAMLLERMEQTARRANAEVLTSPLQAPRVVRSTNASAAQVAEFREVLEADPAHQDVEARRWWQAATEAGQAAADAITTGASSGAQTVKDLGSRAKSRADRVRPRISIEWGSKADDAAPDDEDARP